MQLAQIVQRRIELIDDRQNLAGVNIRQAPGHQHGFFILGDEAAHQMGGQQADVFLDRLNPLITGIHQPAAQTVERPDIAQPSGLFNRGVRIGDNPERFGIIEGSPILPLDHHVDWVGAGQLLIEPAGGFQRLLAVRHLIGEAIARRQRQMRKPEQNAERQPHR